MKIACHLENLIVIGCLNWCGKVLHTFLVGEKRDKNSKLPFAFLVHLFRGLIGGAFV